MGPGKGSNEYGFRHYTILGLQGYGLERQNPEAERSGQNKIVVRCANTIYPYSLGFFQ